MINHDAADAVSAASGGAGRVYHHHHHLPAPTGGSATGGASGTSSQTPSPGLQVNKVSKLLKCKWFCLRLRVTIKGKAVALSSYVYRLHVLQNYSLVLIYIVTLHRPDFYYYEFTICNLFQGSLLVLVAFTIAPSDASTCHSHPFPSPRSAALLI